jgi:para-aminobenzoate synthetase component 2
VILLIDNYDSFVHNLARYFERLGQETVVVRNDAITPAAARRLQPQAIVISPGPCTPAEAGCSTAIVSELSAGIPMLGVCLGHQAMAAI